MTELIRNKQIISHELLTEVLGTKAYQMTGKAINWLMNIRDNDIVYESYAEQQYLIDADQLGRLCKEWTLKHIGKNLPIYETIDVSSFYNHREIELGNNKELKFTYIVTLRSYYHFTETGKEYLQFQADTEIEAIIKATEYVYNKIKGEIK